MGDLLDITASPGQTGSQLMLSAFINGMHERKSVALTRWVAKGTKANVAEPKIGILWPALHMEGHEFCYWAQVSHLTSLYSDQQYLTSSYLSVTFCRRY